ncbi:hypothetical protein GCM10010977_27580 [Citricoccus zhacaiensis]|uniref:DUF6318 domain-containing protein n=1 Tax=Citricoccus zhacaiensis TaxID=489142 RepID=A0ABQ2M7Z1_9MICC|nr:DUF6318 family protein [Citricoccus zhacaiensis]GGO48314.1 hypothetical protein GCM10010977_27580 [Citricoccus zhacaiensis]
MTDPVNRPVRLAGLAGVMAVGLALTGCSGDGGEGESSPATPSATAVSSESASSDGSSSASPSSSASGSYEPATETSPAKNVPVPEMPEAAKEPTEEGLEAAVEFWWETSFYLRETGDAEPMKNVSAEECAFCADQVVRLTDIYEAGSWVVTGPAEIEMQFTKLDPDHGGGTTAFLSSESAVDLFRSNGEHVPEASGGETEDDSWVAALTFDDDRGHWVLDELNAQGQ